MAKARFRVAYDRTGKPISATRSVRIAWRIPDKPRVSVDDHRPRLIIPIGADLAPGTCRTEPVIASAAMAKFCAALRQDMRARIAAASDNSRFANREFVMESGLLLGEESGLAIVTGDKTIMNLEAAAAAIEIGSDGKVIACRSIRDDRSKKTRPYCDMALREKYAPLGPEVVNRQPRHAVRYTAFLIREARH